MAKRVLSFGDSLITEEDLQSLEMGLWLGDSVISFAFEYFQKIFEEDVKKKKVCFVGAAMSQLIKMGDETDVPLFLDELSLGEKNHAIFVINDHSDPNTAGGSHWSLLIFRRKNKPHFLAIDSLSGRNDAPTKKLARILAAYLSVPVNMRFEEATKQTNSNDCGIFVIEYTRLYMENLQQGGKKETDFTSLRADEMERVRQVWATRIRTLATDNEEEESS
ncbi:unnamed protein product [Gongylonema pulchrum]|uniref:ULP_PROTEASE domain-containing protein n=1 Tax=Gongylonema pulchrum TaxID=637853 RepID=A0A183DXY1_9BILA|nr:unnamed protein product [Gongylonema pulchrum]